MANFRATVRVFIDANLSPEAQSARIATVARETLASTIASGRAGPVYTTAVDGRLGVPESSVRPDGQITYQWAYVGEAAEFALAFLRNRALPGETYTYLRGFRVAVNGRTYNIGQFRKDSVPADAEVLIYNLQPYSRKIDTGYSGRGRLKYRIPPGLFDDAARAVRGRFGNSVSAKRLYTVRFTGQYKIARGRDAGRIVDSPALAITGLQ